MTDNQSNDADKKRSVHVESTGKKLSNSQQKELHEHISGRGLISSVALGISDGLVTNLSFLAGFAGADAIGNISLIRFAGTASMLAGAVSMFFGALLAARSEVDLFRADSSRESNEIEEEPEEERAELTSFYLDKGLTPEEARMVVGRVTKDKKKWLEDMMIHELHLHEQSLEKPFKAGLATGLSFLLGAFVPLSAYLLSGSIDNSIIASFAVSLSFLFLVGAWKGRIAGRRSWSAGLEMLLIGACAAIILYVIGRAIVFV